MRVELLILVCLATGFAATYLSLLLMRALGRIDQPMQHHTHTTATPRAGALGIVVLALVYLMIDPQRHFASGIWLIPALGLLGLVDDLYPQPAWQRLSWQLALCAVVVVNLGDSDPSGPARLVRVINIFVAVAMINAANFFDGRNGLLAGNFIFLLLALPILGVKWLLALPLAALWLGFLPFNFPRARIFMGDAGSYFIGATLAWLWLRVGFDSRREALSLLVVMSAILADPVLTLLTRASQGKKIWRSHREHLYQWLARSGLDDRTLLLSYLAYALISAFWARWMMQVSTLYALGLTALWCLGTSVLWMAARRRVLAHARARRRTADGGH